MPCTAPYRLDIPRLGWTCVDVEDLGGLVGECELCGTSVRYVHHMSHPGVADVVKVGCVCAGHLEEDYAAPVERERRLKSRAAKRERWLTRRWLVSQAGNLRLTINGRSVGVFRDPYAPGRWKVRIEGQFSRNNYPTADAAKLALFDYLNPAAAPVPAHIQES